MAGLWCIQSILTILEMAGAYLFVDYISNEKVFGWRKWILITVMGALTCLTIYQRTYSMYSRIWLIQCILICWIIAVVCYRKKKTCICIAYAIYFETLYCLDLFLCIGFATAFPKKNFLINLLQVNIERIVVYLIVRCTMAVFLVALLYKKKVEVTFYFKMNQFVWVVILVSEHMGLIMCDRVFIPGLERDAIENWRVFMLFYPLMLIMLMFYFLKQKYRIMYEQIKIQNIVYCDQYAAMEKKYREKEQVYHDFRNHMIILQRLVFCDKIIEAQNYLSNLLKNEKRECMQKIGHPILDYLLQVKILEAQQKNIQIEEKYDCNLCQLDDESLKDWGALLGNLWDNAIEGCECCGEKKKIFFSMKQIGNMIQVQMENTCRSDVNPKRLETTKADFKIHGIGMQSIGFVVEKHEGMIDRKCKDGIFQMKIIMIE